MRAARSAGKKQVVVLHGLARTRYSMVRMERSLRDAGYDVLNIGYPSTRYPITSLVQDRVLPRIDAWMEDRTVPVDFVTHSMGGILVRAIAREAGRLPIRRVVMLGPPNQGSEVVDVLGGQWWFRKLNGPAGGELGTGPESTPNRLGPAVVETGIIAGNRSLNWILSTMIQGPNDGKVSVERAKLSGMKDFLVLPVTHTFMSQNRSVIRHTLHFLERGSF